jgi:predicted transcriptional regulator
LPPETPMDRPDLYVVARMLERLWRAEEPMVKTRLQVASRVNYDIFSRYLTWMLSKNLVSLNSKEDGHERVSLTPDGEEAYRKLVQWIDEVIHDNAVNR